MSQEQRVAENHPESYHDNNPTADMVGDFVVWVLPRDQPARCTTSSAAATPGVRGSVWSSMRRT